MEHRYKKRNNAEQMELRGTHMFKCICGKPYQTKRQAERHCKKMNEEK